MVPIQTDGAIRVRETAPQGDWAEVLKLIDEALPAAPSTGSE